MTVESTEHPESDVGRSKQSGRWWNTRDVWQTLLGLVLPATFVIVVAKLHRFLYWRDALRNPSTIASVFTLSRGSIWTTVSEAPLDSLVVVRADLMFMAAVGLLAVVVVASIRRRRLRLVGMGLIQISVIALCELEVASLFYFVHTGSNLDLNLLGLFFKHFSQFQGIISAEAGTSRWPIIVALGVFLTVFPWALRRVLAERVADRRAGAAPIAAMSVAAAGLIGLSLLSTPDDLPDAVAQNCTLNMAHLALKGTTGPDIAADSLEASPLFGRLEPDADKPASNKPAADGPASPDDGALNVVVMVLESMRPADMSVYHPEMPGPPTTPFLESIADDSLVFDRHYTTVTHTSKALVSIMCGVLPHYRTMVTEAQPNGIPARCLPELLGRQGYSTGFFQTATSRFEHRLALVGNMGFDHSFTAEDVTDPRFEVTNYFGYEEDAMLQPSLDWVTAQVERGRPFMLAYLTLMTHTPYTPPGVAISGRSPKDIRQNYRDAIRYTDKFIKQVVDHFRDVGLYDNTVFVFVSDHGEGFGEHGMFNHNGVVYEEGVRAALIIDDPHHRGQHRSTSDPSWHVDLLPTIVDALGMDIRQADYPGRGLLDVDPLRSSRRLVMHGWYENRALASVQGRHKFIYHFGERDAQSYDLDADPGELDELALTDRQRHQETTAVLAARNRDLLRYRLFHDKKLNQQRLEPADVVPEVAAQASVAKGVEVIGADRPLAVGDAHGRNIAVYARLQVGAYPTGVPMRLRMSGGKTIDFDLIDEPVEVDQPTVLARRISFGVGDDHPPIKQVDVVDADSGDTLLELAPHDGQDPAPTSGRTLHTR